MRCSTGSSPHWRPLWPSQVSGEIVQTFLKCQLFLPLFFCPPSSSSSSRAGSRRHRLGGADWWELSGSCGARRHLRCVQARAEHHPQPGRGHLQGVCPAVRHALPHLQSEGLQCGRHPALPHTAAMAGTHGGRGQWVGLSSLSLSLCQ